MGLERRLAEGERRDGGTGGVPAVLLLAVVALAVARVAVSCAGPTGPGKRSGAGRQQAAEPPAGGGGAGGDWRVTVLAEGLEVPWALAVDHEGTLLVTERPGRVRVIRGGRLLPEPAAHLSGQATGSPRRRSCWTASRAPRSTTAGACGSGRLAWDGAGRLYAAEHGPSGEYGLCCRDEVNWIERGRFYGWPLRAGRDDTGAAALARELPPPAGPLSTSGPDTWAPAGMAFLPDETGRTGASLLVVTLRGEHLRRVVLAKGDGTARETPLRIIREEVVLRGYGRLREVLAAPGGTSGGCLYVLTSNRDGRGRPAPEDDRLLQVCPAPAGSRRPPGPGG